MLKNAHKNQLLVVYQNKAINISISKWKARLDKYTCFISLHAGRPAQQENFNIHDRLIKNLSLQRILNKISAKTNHFQGLSVSF